MSNPKDDLEQVIAAAARTNPGLLVGMVATVMLELKEKGWPVEDLDSACTAMCAQLGVDEADVRKAMAQAG